jgi:hypothetical protein
MQTHIISPVSLIFSLTHLGTYYTEVVSKVSSVIGGYHQTVGPSGGWVMGGGHSILSPVYGLGVDRVVRTYARHRVSQLQMINH